MSRYPKGIIFYLEGGREKEAKLVDYRVKVPGDSYYWYKVDENLARLKYFVIHHSATPANWTPDQIAQIHLNKGWKGIGYHFVITQDGTIYYVGDLGTWRANVLNRNHEIIGVLLVGDFRDGRVPTDAQYKAANVLFREFKADSRFTGIKNNTSLKFHNELQATVCPGNVNKDWILNGKPVPQPAPQLEPIKEPVIEPIIESKPEIGAGIPTPAVTEEELEEYEEEIIKETEKIMQSPKFELNLRDIKKSTLEALIAGGIVFALMMLGALEGGNYGVYTPVVVALITEASTLLRRYLRTPEF